ncbi:MULTISPECIES: 16S rRNA (cytosine(967)-C(5))-methyltransferase RsmB [Lysinibacillus]|uniref:16S rRNA (cytosine(967)-C(5))-methyltransferase RsmB n=1 Tax=Lysinibacillus TaxID=400634 RepID=UPI001245A60D|nr:MULTISPECIES: 16S rRNA (cytosine(967)-C(5))-methyltransferase RsmB [Lysinibacillus]MDC6268637.1 16S rRNA (cytosine(967)-C(5))-methyltransferase RsmB [Lysinibacillus sphaericus]KAB0441901.1 16S rRNA (cytosine(967)-C(5))-methyltransferase [Lysinibacillus fusiformis]MCE4043733.1 16S rRNA (cytosine(967)-C(5))-methyltransferase RsmB [Lysinibacillus fusiformis]MCK1986826.1 16S rRNA (cytosine(967)-C(5))-methyltransferase RsmB [Lysinibacillus fusiformis]MDN4969430.1 16S rRNA (cytosine(967)-C(5))-me
MSKKSVVIWDGNVRDAALSILLAVDKNQAYSNLLLNETIKRHKIEAKDRALLTELTYGTLQHKMTLDYYLEPFIRGSIDHWVRWLLRISLYQMQYLTRIPAHAAVNEAVEIAKRRGHRGIASTVNGILRSVLRQGVPAITDIENPIERLAIETSHPIWLVQRFVDNYGLEVATGMLHENNVPPMQTVRVNTTKVTVEQAIAELEAEGLTAKQSDVIPECLHLTNGQPARTHAFKEGHITIQDESSMIPANVLNPSPGMRVLDMCAAPGGKTTHLAEIMKNEGSILATDLHPHKLDLIDHNTERLGLDIIETAPIDGRKAPEFLQAESYDAVLVDAPCSGLGVMRRKPDIKYTKREEDLENLQTIQLALLDAATKVLKIEGKLVYSTCTVDIQENEGTVKAFLATHPEMEAIQLESLPTKLAEKQANGMLQVFPQDFGSDGFFVAAFRKKGESN